MSGPSFEGPIEGRNVLVGNSASQGGTFNVNIYHADSKSGQENEEETFALTPDLSQVTEVAHFVARREELAQMHEILEHPQMRRTAILHGLGGMGKTQLTIAYIKRHYTDYSAVIWLNAKDETSLKQSFVPVAERIARQHPSSTYIKNAVESRDLDQSVQAVNRWLDEPRNNRWLIIYDNYDTPKLYGREDERESTSEAASTGAVNEEDPTEVETVASKAFDIRPFLPTSFHGAIIITTRSSAVKLGRLIHLQKLKDIKDSLEILTSTSHRQDAYHDDAATQLAQRLDGLPLALSTAGAYLEETAMSWGKYLKLYDESWLRLQRESPRLLSYENRAMYSTWNISYKHIKRENEAAAMVLKLWAYFDNEDLWYELLQRGESDTTSWLGELVQDELRFHQAMRVLCRYSLVEAGSRGYSIHGCIHSWIINALHTEVRVDMAQLAISCVALHLPNSSEPEYWLVQRRLLRHVDRCAKIMELGLEPQEGDEWILHDLGMLYEDQCRYSDAEAMYERALQGREKIYGAEHTSTLDTVNNLGLLYAHQGRLSDAEAMYERALRGYEEVYEAEHTSTLSTVNNLGNLYSDQGRLSDAEAMHERALRDKEKIYGPEHTSTIDTVNNLGNLYKNQGRLSDAEPMYERALRGYEKAWGPEHISTLGTAHNLGNLYKSQGRFSDAKAMYERALRGYEKALGSPMCDGKRPACSQCLCRALECGGYEYDLIFVSSNLSGPPPAKTKTKKATNRKRQRELPLISPPPEEAEPEIINQHGMAITRSPTWPQNDIISVVVQNFTPMMNKRSVFSGEGEAPRICGAWIELLPSLSSSPLPEKALSASVKALGICILARGHKGRAPMSEALAAHCKALSSLHKSLLHVGSADSNVLVAAIMCLIISELLLPALNSSSTAHADGLGHLMQLHGPEFYSSGSSHRLFVGSRPAMIIQAICMKHPSFLANDEWKTIPFQNEPPAPLQALLTEGIAFPSIFADMDALEAKLPHARSPETILDDLVDLLIHLKGWDTAYQDVLSKPQFRVVGPNGYHGLLWYSDITMANCMIHYWAFWVMCIVYIRKIRRLHPSLTKLPLLIEGEIPESDLLTDVGIQMSTWTLQSVAYLTQDEMKLFGATSLTLPVRVAYKFLGAYCLHDEAKLLWSEKIGEMGP
ncbi:Kinesin light chain 1 [Cladobotryum mycophilum]|uniref:Kinesin light chain 1 n=1 Tax=Cladobotryum mycophilum TaxID=491253 RepID=A0ABR0SKU1_9HYPO